MASTVKLCVPKKEGGAILTPKHGKCTRTYKLTTLGHEGKAGKQGAEGKAGAEGKTGPEGKEGGPSLTAEQRTKLLAILPYIKYEEKGVGGEPTIQFSAVNVQIVNGEGKTETTNGEGNLVIGYDENSGSHKQTGSHNLILGEERARGASWPDMKTRSQPRSRL